MNISLPSDFELKNSLEIVGLYNTADFNFYGSHQYNPLPGGRPVYRVPEVHSNQFESYIQGLNDRKINFRYVMTGNHPIQDQQVSSYVKYLIDAGVKNFVIRNNNLLPLFDLANSDVRIIKSLIGGEFTAGGVERCINSGYDKVSVNIHKICKIDQLLPLLPYSNKIELLLNSCCLPLCPNCLDHYHFYEDTFRKNTESGNTSFIDIWNLNCTIEFLENPQNFISSSFFTGKMFKQLAELGFQNFKLAGRGGTHAGLLNVLQYYLGSNHGHSSFDIMVRGGMKYLTPFMDILDPKILAQIKNSIEAATIVDFDEIKYSYFNGNPTPSNIEVSNIDSRWLKKLKRIRNILNGSYQVDKSTEQKIVQVLLS